MKPQRFRIVKHLTAALFATAMLVLFMLGVDGLLRGMNELTRLFAARQPAAATDPGAVPGVVPAFIVPVDGAATGRRTGRRPE